MKIVTMGMERVTLPTGLMPWFAELSGRVLKSGKPVCIQTPEGLVQVGPCPSDEVKADPPLGELTEEDLRLLNTFGETFGYPKS